MLNYLIAIIQAVENAGKVKFDNPIMKNESLIEVGKSVTRMIQDEAAVLKSTISQYNSSNYFHVGPRRHMFGVMRKLINQANLLRTKVGPIDL